MFLHCKSHYSQKTLTLFNCHALPISVWEWLKKLFENDAIQLVLQMDWPEVAVIMSFVHQYFYLRKTIKIFRKATSPRG